MKILVVEDEKDLNKIITKYLKKSNYSVDSAYDGEEALDYINVGEYDVIILDIMMPKMNGYDFIKQIRRDKNNVAVLMLTAKDSLEDKVKGLDLGADDYLVKPFEFDELLARIRAMLRRNYRESATNILVIGDVELDTVKKSVTKNGNIIELTAKEYEVLEYLLRNKNHILSREQIREHVWDFDYEGESNIIDVLIKNIRQKIDDNKEESIIQTKRGVNIDKPGYKFKSLLSCIHEMGGSLNSVEIVDVRGTTFYARLNISCESGRHIEIDAQNYDFATELSTVFSLPQ